MSAVVAKLAADKVAEVLAPPSLYLDHFAAGSLVRFYWRAFDLPRMVIVSRAFDHVHDVDVVEHAVAVTTDEAECPVWTFRRVVNRFYAFFRMGVGSVPNPGYEGDLLL